MIEVEQFKTNEATQVFLNDLKQLTSKAFGNRFSDDDWEHGLGGTHIAVRKSGILVSHAAVVPRHLYVGEKVYLCGYVENVATSPDWQHRGLASLAMRRANTVITRHYEVGALSSSSKDLYRKLGWEDWRGPSYVIAKNEWSRSESEDEGVMVLKIDANSDLDLSFRIACEERSGDSW